MNINVWIIIKICKALNQSFWGVWFLFCFVFLPAFHSNPTTLPFPPRSKTSELLFLLAVLMYRQVLWSSTKCLFSLGGELGASTSLGLPVILSFSACLVFAAFLQETKETWPFRATHSTLATDLHSHSIVSERHQCRGRVLAHECQAAPGCLYRRLEVMSKQVIIMRWALQKLTRLSRRSVTHSSASRYSRESSSNTCSRSTAKRGGPGWGCGTSMGGTVLSHPTRSPRPPLRPAGGSLACSLRPDLQHVCCPPPAAAISIAEFVKLFLTLRKACCSSGCIF